MKRSKIIVREGSLAKNLEALYPIINKHPGMVMLCTDDIHPDDLMYKGHMDYVVKTALSYGCNLFNILRAATHNPVKHYKLPVGLLRVGDPADFILVNSLSTFAVSKTYINGQLLYDAPNVLLPYIKPPTINNFVVEPISESDVAVPALGEDILVIDVVDKQLYTPQLVAKAKLNAKKEVVSDTDNDILKIVVMNRYQKAKPAIGFIHGFGLKRGALAISVAHDAHNIVCVGTDDESIAHAINLVIKAKGGAVATGNKKDVMLELPIAGLMSDMEAEDVGKKYQTVQSHAKELGCTLIAPFSTLTFMALPVNKNAESLQQNSQQPLLLEYHRATSHISPLQIPLSISLASCVSCTRKEQYRKTL
eukprot:TRINITY_DN1537_c0_g1_i3.p2 TRINITY_DN1537_c0_g1~~TRINITY_DN1537_c0_g1_i3.p2  ORF type:complete len:364 (+),score=31.19 TRINITY_DN1537_c0_g1_i3:824-1915(+)